MVKEAMLYCSQEDKKVVCALCSHRCQIAPGKRGICAVRENRDGRLNTHVYGEVIAAHVDPIEKKPLYHFLPGTMSFSIATAGCNFRCPYCQNWQISQAKQRGDQGLSGQPFPPEEVVKATEKHRCQSISYTYTEPTIFFEYAYDTAQLAKEKGLANVFVTNGFMTSEALEAIHPSLDACNVDLKSFREEFYEKMCRAHLEPVLASIRLMRELDIWVEITTLVIPDLNDSEEELSEIARFIAGVDPAIPWHISRFHPDYHYTDSYVTPLETLGKARAIGKREGLAYVYIGNVLGEGEDTLCSQCGKILIRRQGYMIVEKRIVDSRCPFCQSPVSGIF